MRTILKGIKDDQVRAYFVWLPCIETDDRASALERAKEFSDPRLRHYWDGERLTGISWDKILNTGDFAWDVYMIYGSAAKWDKASPPSPDFWMHQLMGVENVPTLDRNAFEIQIKRFLSH